MTVSWDTKVFDAKRIEMNVLKILVKMEENVMMGLIVSLAIAMQALLVRK